MKSLALFDLAFRKNEWLAQRQSLIASNIANANTPGFKSKVLASFEDVMQASAPSSALPMQTTQSAHLAAAESFSPSLISQSTSKAEVLQSGNNVTLEDEFLKSGDVMRQFSLNTQVTKAFSRMLTMASKA